MKGSNLGDKDQYENKDSDHHITIIPRNDPQIHIKLDQLRRIISESTTETDLI